MTSFIVSDFSFRALNLVPLLKIVLLHVHHVILWLLPFCTETEFCLRASHFVQIVDEIF
jgi:hypothetical protein